MYKIAVLASTRGTNFQSFLDAKARGELENVEIACLITNKPHCGAAEKAKAAGIPVYAIDQTDKTREEFDLEVMKVLDGLKVDLVVLGGYMRIIGPEMVRRYKNRIINIHPSLLPRHPGMDLSVHQEVLDDDDKETGMTIHFIDEGVDTGPIVFQKSVPVEAGDTAEKLKDKVQGLEKEWYPKVVRMFAENKLPKK
ncbi:phosphoribosylglycinamide formyltransferase [Candidatus Peregrinibacteria bacterium]|nr:phosphoribosylglycinamide formyltransferase [Candidatus Peregrinibacteria bacterium]